MKRQIPGSVLIYNLYLVNNWKQVTLELFQNVPQQDIFVHISYAGRRSRLKIPFVIIWLKWKFGVKKVFVSKNDSLLGECVGFEKFRKRINWNNYDMGTYLHSKGVTKPANNNVAAWREFMRYFIMDRMDLCQKAFADGNVLYGVYLLESKSKKTFAYQYTDFLYSGNFVSFNLHLVRKNFVDKVIDPNYYGVEAFWGKLCGVEKAFNAYELEIDLYENAFPKHLYQSK